MGRALNWARRLCVKSEARFAPSMATTTHGRPEVLGRSIKQPAAAPHSGAVYTTQTVHEKDGIVTQAARATAQAAQASASSD